MSRVDFRRAISYRENLQTLDFVNGSAIHRFGFLFGNVIQVETKSGTNDFHGSAFEFLQNNIFQARDPFTQGLHAPRTPAPPNRGISELPWNQFGGSIGGPIKKDKLFFFGDYQGTQRRIGASQSIRVPTAAERTGNLSDLGVPIYDPSTGNPDGTGRAVFPGANLAGRISPPATALVAALPLPNIASTNPAAPNYAVGAVENYNTNQFDTRGDYFKETERRFYCLHTLFLLCFLKQTESIRSEKFSELRIL